MESKELRNFQQGQSFIIGDGETIDEIQANERWLKSDLWLDPTSIR